MAIYVKAIASNEVQNGRIVVSVTGGADTKTVNPPENVVMTSGEMGDMWDDRFMYHYGNAPSGIGV